jgi:hypothetical protein
MGTSPTSTRARSMIASTIMSHELEWEMPPSLQSDVLPAKAQTCRY